MLIPDSTSLVFDAIIVTARRGVGSFLTFDFKLNAESQGREDYHLWIYLTDWLITQNANQLLDSMEENDAPYEKVLHKFLGKKLIKFSMKDHIIKFEFENKLEINLSPDCDFYEPSDELFLFFNRKEKLVTTYTLENGLITGTLEEKGSESV